MVPRSTLGDFFRDEATGGLLLIAAAALALVAANSAAAGAYQALFALRLGPLDLRHWIDDGLMALFFLVVGLEIKRAFVSGDLADPAARALPILTAVGGMAVPALCYLAVTRGAAGLGAGWAVPAATDIAFALAVLALAGPRVPASLKLFLTTVAIVDDMGAVAIIAVAYTAGIDALALAAAAAILVLMAVLNRRGVTALPPYLLLGAGLWAAVLLSGVHPTVAGVLTAFAIPLGREAGAPLERLEGALHPWVALGVVPLFGFANAGVALDGLGPSSLLAPLPLGIAAGLFLGKQIGVFASLRLAVALGLGRRPQGASWAQCYGLALLCGVGFTMSLFVGALAFADPAMLDQVKIGVLGGSILSALAGLAVLRLAGPAARS